MITHFEDKKIGKNITQLIRGTIVKKKKNKKNAILSNMLFKIICAIHQIMFLKNDNLSSVAE